MKLINLQEARHVGGAPPHQLNKDLPKKDIQNFLNSLLKGHKSKLGTKGTHRWHYISDSSFIHKIAEKFGEPDLNTRQELMWEFPIWSRFAKNSTIMEPQRKRVRLRVLFPDNPRNMFGEGKTFSVWFD